MTRAAHSEEYTRECGQVLYVAFELGAKEWKLGFTTDLAAPVRGRVGAAGGGGARPAGRDARKLVGMLVRYHTGEPRVWSVLRVPTVAAEDGRQLHRALRTLKQDLWTCPAR